MDTTTKETNQRSVEAFMETIEERHPNQSEYHQAVQELLGIELPYIDSKAEYQKQALLERLTEPDRVLTFRVTWHDDDGNIQVNRGYRVQFNNAIGPYKGGLRFHPTVNLSILKFLGFEQIFKNSLTTLPMGGGKGGADFNPKGKSDREIMRFCQAFMSELYHHLGPELDVPAGDIGVGSREVGYLFGMYKKLTHRHQGVLTGKGFPFGGSHIRPEATGYGLVYFVEEMMRAREENLEGKRVNVSGSGNVAQYAVEKAIQSGATVHTMSDSSGCVFDEEGITEEKLAWIKDLKNNRRGRIKEYADEYGVQYLEGDNPWSIPCDIALPCATQNELGEEDAQKLVENGVQIVGEGANMPTTADGIRVFQEARILYAPGKAANAGGVATSGLEMAQNSQKLNWTAYEVDCKLKEIMQNIHRQCCEYGHEDDGYINYVKGANLAGFVKVADAIIGQGVI
jgi:glutamate dehydrogenase (NADP+)